MLALNDELYKIPDEFKDKINKRKGTHLTFKLCKHYEWTDKHTKKKRLPNSISLEVFYQFKPKGANEHGMFRWAQNRVARSISGQEAFEYTPALITFGNKGVISVDKKNLDMIYFLWNHPDNEGNADRNTKKRAKFYLENKDKEAKVSAEGNKLFAKVIQLIWSESDGLDIDELRTIAKSMGIPSTEDMPDDGIRNLLNDLATENPKEFLARTSGANLVVKSAIQDAIDKDVIYYDKESRNWCFVSRDGGPGDVICTVRPQESRMDRLTTFLTKEDRSNVLEQIESSIKEKKRSEGTPSEARAPEEEEAAGVGG